MEIQIKTYAELTTAELYEILRCRAEVFVVGQNCVYQDLDGKDERSLHLFLADGPEILSYLRVIAPPSAGAPASIGRVLTVEHARRRGLSRRLMQRGIEVAKTLADTIEIDAQAYLIDFYRSLGFAVCSDEYLIDRLPHFRMKM